jgi:hypothetical protein
LKIIKHIRSNWFQCGFETLAVVVGILAALTVGNWNGVRKQNILEIQHLQGLFTDLSNDAAQGALFHDLIVPAGFRTENEPVIHFFVYVETGDEEGTWGT